MPRPLLDGGRSAPVYASPSPHGHSPKNLLTCASIVSHAHFQAMGGYAKQYRRMAPRRRSNIADLLLTLDVVATSYERGVPVDRTIAGTLPSSLCLERLPFHPHTHIFSVSVPVSKVSEVSASVFVQHFLFVSNSIPTVFYKIFRCGCWF